MIPITDRVNYIRKELDRSSQKCPRGMKRILGSVDILLSRYESRPTGYLPVSERLGGSGKSERISDKSPINWDRREQGRDRGGPTYVFSNVNTP